MQLEKPLGDSDGTAVDGVRYFSCDPYYGSYVQEHQLSPFVDEDHAANTVSIERLAADGI